ncbi:MAG: hypothetical protein ACRC0L_03265, partial [Angustibacter sp.]
MPGFIGDFDRSRVYSRNAPEKSSMGRTVVGSSVFSVLGVLLTVIVDCVGIFSWHFWRRIYSS